MYRGCTVQRYEALQGGGGVKFSVKKRYVTLEWVHSVSLHASQCSKSCFYTIKFFAGIVSLTRLTSSFFIIRAYLVITDQL